MILQFSRGGLGIGRSEGNAFNGELATAIAKGRYHRIHPAIVMGWTRERPTLLLQTLSYIPVPTLGDTYHDVLTSIGALKTRPANAYEILQASFEDQSLGTQFAVVCFGTIYYHFGFRRRLMCLRSCLRGRVLDLIPMNYHWKSQYSMCAGCAPYNAG